MQKVERLERFALNHNTLCFNIPLFHFFNVYRFSRYWGKNFPNPLVFPETPRHTNAI